MIIRMKTTAVGPDCHLVAGNTYDVPDERAADLLAGNYAEEVTAAGRGPIAETATTSAPENADARPRRRGINPK